MKTIVRLLLVLPVLFSFLSVHAQDGSSAAAAAAAPAAAPAADSSTKPAIDPAKEAEIRKMLELTGTVRMTNQVLQRMISSFKMQHGDVQAAFWDRFEKEVNTQQLVEQIIPVYDKYYTLDDLKAVNAFYESPAGQRLLAATPQIMQESMAIGQKWGQNLGLKVEEELQEEKEKEASQPAAASAPTPTTK